MTLRKIPACDSVRSENMVMFFLAADLEDIRHLLLGDEPAHQDKTGTHQ